MKRLLLILLTVILAAGSALAVPAKPGTKKVKQADGTYLTVQLVGDERHHYSRTLDGIPLARRADGSYCYARLEGNRLIPTEMLAHEAKVRTTEEVHFISRSVAKPEELTNIRRKIEIERNKLLSAEYKDRKISTNSFGEPKPTKGQHKGLVILVNFKDVSFRPEYTREVFEKMLNGKNYTDFGNSCSVNEYFKAQSYGEFDLTFDVAGPYTLEYNMAHYGGNDLDGQDKLPERMVWEACRQADKEGIKFADYDWDGDKEAEEVFIVYAGYCEAYQDADPNTIWPHMYWLDYCGYRFTSSDGIKVNTYACANELYGTSGNEIEGIGTFCHEFSHCLGLPDFYDTQYSGNFGMSYWSVMDAAIFINRGYTPTGYTAYEKMFCGWLDPTVLNEGVNVAGMRPISESKDAYIIYNDADHDEFYILENRQKKGTDKDAVGHGMLVVHVDYDKTVWKNNTVNNEKKHQRCTIIAADNSYTDSETGLAADPFPGTRRKTALTNTTYPKATLYNANTDGDKLMSKPIEDITESEDGLISFTFNGGGETIGIDQTTTENEPAFTTKTPVEVYASSGNRLMKTTYGRFVRQAMPSGVYILKAGKQIKKVVK